MTLITLGVVSGATILLASGQLDIDSAVALSALGSALTVTGYLLGYRQSVEDANDARRAVREVEAPDPEKAMSSTAEPVTNNDLAFEVAMVRYERVIAFETGDDTNLRRALADLEAARQRVDNEQRT